MYEALPFQEIWLADFEFIAAPGEIPSPVCLVACELRTGRKIRLWQDEFGSKPPYATGPDSLFVAYYASAELGCHLALGWPMPERVLDLFCEFRNRTNGLGLLNGSGLLGALSYFGLDGIGAAAKDANRELVRRGGPWTDGERVGILNYCESDVLSLARLLPVMLPAIDLPRAILRGRYMRAAAVMERNGIPIDAETFERLKEGWPRIKGQLIGEIDKDYGVFEGQTFKTERFSNWLIRTGIPWPRLETDNLDLSAQVFREMSRTYPAVAPLRELRVTLATMRLFDDLAIGSDNRNRTILSAFRSITGRNQPSNSRYAFGPARWLRGLIRPPPGHGIAYIDWSQQEHGIAAALSGDQKLQEAYRSGDPYLRFAVQAGAAPLGATRESHAAVRALFKQCSLAVQYGMEATSLGHRIGQPTIVARDLLRLHRETYPVFWKWSDTVQDHALLHNSLYTVFGWTLHVTANGNPRSFRNFPMQSNGAEMLRLACCLATERGIKLCAPVHDAVLIEAPLEALAADVARTREAMREASRIVLNGFELGTDATIVRAPGRYMDERGAVMWARVMALLVQSENCELSGGKLQSDAA